MSLRAPRLHRHLGYLPGHIDGHLINHCHSGGALIEGLLKGGETVNPHSQGLMAPLGRPPSLSKSSSNSSPRDRDLSHKPQQVARPRRLVAIDETKRKLGGGVYVWAAIASVFKKVLVFAPPGVGPASTSTFP